MKKKEPLLTDEALEMIAARFRVLGEPMRLKLLRSLLDGEQTVSALIEQTQGTQANISRHLNLLLQAGVLSRRKEGLNVYYAIADKGIVALCHLVCGQLQEQLDQKAKTLSLTPDR